MGPGSGYLGNIPWFISLMPFWGRLIFLGLFFGAILLFRNWSKVQNWRISHSFNGPVIVKYQKKPRLSEIRRRRH